MSLLLDRWQRTNSKVNAALLVSFQGSVEVLRKTAVADSQGGFKNTYTSVATYKCSFSKSQVRPRTAEYTVRVQDIAYWAFHFLPGTDIINTDKLRVGTRTFEIIGQGDGSSDVVLEIITQEII